MFWGVLVKLRSGSVVTVREDKPNVNYFGVDKGMQFLSKQSVVKREQPNRWVMTTNERTISDAYGFLSTKPA
jgi:hypothetical protein